MRQVLSDESMLFRRCCLWMSLPEPDAILEEQLAFLLSLKTYFHSSSTSYPVLYTRVSVLHMHLANARILPLVSPDQLPFPVSDHFNNVFADRLDRLVSAAPKVPFPQLYLLRSLVLCHHR